MSNEEFRKPFWQTLKKNRVVFDDAYEEEINGLLALSQTEIDTITPDDIDVKTYDELIMIASNARI